MKGASNIHLLCTVFIIEVYVSGEQEAITQTPRVIEDPEQLCGFIRDCDLYQPFGPFFCL